MPSLESGLCPSHSWFLGELDGKFRLGVFGMCPLRRHFYFTDGYLTASFRLCLISSLVGALNMFINIGFGTFDPHGAEAIAGLVLVCVLILGYGMVVAWCSASVERPAGLSGNRSEPTMDMLNTVFPKDERTPYAHQPSSLLNVFSSEDLSRTEAHCEVAKPEHCYRSVSEYPLCAGPHNYPSRVQTPWR